MGYNAYYGSSMNYGVYEPPDNDQSDRVLKKGIYSKLVILLVILLNVGFTIYIVESMKVMLFEPTVLVGGWFAFTSAEVGACAWVKVKKEDKKSVEKVKELEETVRQLTTIVNESSNKKGGVDDADSYERVSGQSSRNVPEEQAEERKDSQSSETHPTNQSDASGIWMA